jgi:hypothetical protein
LTAEHPNATAYRRAAAAFRAGDLAHPEDAATWDRILGGDA